ncbi:MAG: acyltransferase family protein [Eggerthellaceae bacterium]|jgi:peptidoglycan/LPS O-acetylase OafA/YrhL
MIAQKRRIFGMPGGIACELCILQMRGGRLRRAKAACCGRLRDASAGSGRSRCAFAVLSPFWFLEFAIGGCIAVVYRSRTHGGRIVRSSLVQVGAVVAFLAVYGAHLIDAKNPTFSHTFIFPETLLMFAACCTDGVLSDIGRTRVVRKLSALSMPFFMTHPLVILIVQRYVFAPGTVSAASIAMFFVTLVLALAVAYAVQVVDKRVQRLLA